MDEGVEWKEIPGFEKYWISERGIWSDKRKKMLKPTLKKRQRDIGRKMYELRTNGKRYSKHFARWYMLTFCPIQDSDKLMVDHINGNHTDDRPANLRWVTRSQNSRNRKVEGKYPYKFIRRKKVKGYECFIFTIQCRESKNFYKAFNKKKYKLVDALAYRNWYCLVNNIEILDRC